VGVALAAAALVVYAFLPEPVPVTVGRVESGPMRVTLDAEGEVRAYERYVVAAPVAGRLLRVELRAGDPVLARQTVAGLAPLPLSAREREEQEARVAATEALAREADERVRKARAMLEQSRRDRVRAERLVQQELIAVQTAEEARIAETAAARELDAALYHARAATAEVDAARAGLVALRAAGSGGGPSLLALRAPVGGQVLRVHEKSERVVLAGTPVVTIGDLSRLEVVVDYLTTDAVRIRPGMTMLLENWGGPGALRARVRVVEPGAFIKVSALGVEERRTNVVADFVDPPGLLRDGYRVDGQVVMWESERTLKVPVASLFRLGEGWAVFVVEDDRARRRVVTVGQRNTLEAEVLAGLEEGQRVVRHPPRGLDDGDAVVAH
jgi:HlyD family secretion protein